MTYPEILTIHEDKNIPALELAIVSILVNGIEKGDFTRIGFLLEQSLGKIPVMVEDFDEDDLAREVLRSKPLKELLKLAHDNLPTEATDEV